MRALTVVPRVPGSAELETLDRAPGEPGGIAIRPLAVGICGTDREILKGEYGEAAEGRSRLVLGHECVARVESGAAGAFRAGELVVPIVRRPDPVPCANCARGEWDMCRNGRYREHGIKGLDGFCAEQLLVDPQYLVPVPEHLAIHAVLVEPTSIVAKAWEHIERIGHRAYWSPRTVLVTGAGPVGLLAALLGRQRGYDVCLFDRETDGPKPHLAHALGASYVTDDLPRHLAQRPPDVVLECTGAAAVILAVLSDNARAAITCLLGVSAPGHTAPVDVGALNGRIVLQNDVVFGSVNANRRHYEAAVMALDAADPAWLSRLISRRVPLERWREAVERQVGDVKTIIELADQDASLPQARSPSGPRTSV
jgi:threonine dehydrogenase-like Zn-dependent dehydrogenase